MNNIYLQIRLKIITKKVVNIYKIQMLSSVKNRRLYR